MNNNKENVLVDVKAKDAYLYNQNDLQSIMVNTASAEDNSTVIMKTKGSSATENCVGSFQTWLSNRLQLKDAGIIGKTAANVAEITVERTPSVLVVSAGAFTYTVPLQQDKLGLTRIAAPYKATFRPVATRYELEPENTQALLNTVSRYCADDKVYRISGSGNEPVRFCYMTPDFFKELAGINVLNDGRAVCKHKTIKVFKLDTGFGLKLGDNAMFSATEANPKYKEKETLFVKQQDPDTSRWYLEPVKVKTSKGFNPDLKQFAYDVTMDNGNQLFDIPESDLFVEKVNEQQPKEWSHF